MTILAIDPGPLESGYMLYSPDSPTPIVDHAHLRNEELVVIVRRLKPDIDLLVIEMPSNFGGKPVSPQTLETCYWVGVFAAQGFGKLMRVKAPDWKLYITGNRGAKDAQVKACLEEYFEPTGRDGKKNPSHYGTKKTPGPLYGTNVHTRDALGLALYAASQASA